MIEELKKHDTSKLEQALSKMGYDPSVYCDEMNTYLLTGAASLKREGVLLSKIIKPRVALSKIFEEYFGYAICRAGLKKIMRQMHRLKF